MAAWWCVKRATPPGELIEVSKSEQGAHRANDGMDQATITRKSLNACARLSSVGLSKCHMGLAWALGSPAVARAAVPGLALLPLCLPLRWSRFLVESCVSVLPPAVFGQLGQALPGMLGLPDTPCPCWDPPLCIVCSLPPL